MFGLSDGVRRLAGDTGARGTVRCSVRRGFLRVLNASRDIRRTLAKKPLLGVHAFFRVLNAAFTTRDSRARTYSQLG